MSGGSFNAGTLSNIDDCTAHVQSKLNRGTLSANSKPMLKDVQDWLARAKQELMEAHNFTWRRVFSYVDTVVSTYRYTLPADFGEGGYILRDITNDIRLTPIDSVSFDSIFPDVAGDSTSVPEYYTLKDRELWLSQPASGTYRLELEYERTGDDVSPNTVSYIPELMRFKMCDYAIYRSFIEIENWNAAQAYKGEWDGGIFQSKKRDTRKRWAALGYKARQWMV